MFLAFTKEKAIVKILFTPSPNELIGCRCCKPSNLRTGLFESIILKSTTLGSINFKISMILSSSSIVKFSQPLYSKSPVNEINTKPSRGFLYSSIFIKGILYLLLLVSLSDITTSINKSFLFNFKL